MMTPAKRSRCPERGECANDGATRAGEPRSAGGRGEVREAEGPEQVEPELSTRGLLGSGTGSEVLLC